MAVLTAFSSMNRLNIMKYNKTIQIQKTIHRMFSQMIAIKTFIKPFSKCPRHERKIFSELIPTCERDTVITYAECMHRTSEGDARAGLAPTKGIAMESQFNESSPY